MLRKLVICGLLAGACGGLLATGFAAVVGEPAIGQALVFESARVGATGAGSDVAVVSRDVQSGLGLLSAILLYGVALGGLFALGFGVVYGRVGSAGPARTALFLAAGVFVVVYLVPFLKYPANPPAVGDPSTIVDRTLLYATMLAISIAAAVGALRIRAVSTKRLSASGATIAAGAAYVVLVVAAGLLLPAVSEVPPSFPATTLWDFRIASLGTQAVLWGMLGCVFALTVQRAMADLPILPRRVQAKSSGPEGGLGG